MLIWSFGKGARRAVASDLAKQALDWATYNEGNRTLPIADVLSVRIAEIIGIELIICKKHLSNLQQNDLMTPFLD